MSRILTLFFISIIISVNTGVGSECDTPRPEWIACEDFEKGGLGWGAWFAQSPFVECNGCSGGTNDADRIQLTNNSTDVYAGTWALYLPAEASAGYRGASLTFRSCNGQKRAGCSLTGYDELYFRTWVKLASDHTYVHHFLSLAGTRPNNYWDSDGNAGCKPNGTRWAGTTVDFNRNHELFFYTYYPEMKGDQGGYCSGSYVQGICDGCAKKGMPCDDGLKCYWGNHFAPNPAVMLPQGRWVSLEMMMRLNTPGQADGEMAFWIDDQLAHRVTGMHWRDVSELQLNKAWLQHYIASGDATQSNSIWFDNVVVSTQRIGSGKQSSAVLDNEFHFTVDDFFLGSHPLFIGSTLTFILESPQQITLSIVNLSGKELNIVASQSFKAGNHSISLKGEYYPGVYALKIVGENFLVLRKILIVK